MNLYKSFFLAALHILFMGCNEEIVHHASELCTYENVSDQVEQGEKCETGPFANKITNETGIITFNQSLEKYVVTISVESSIDCQIIGILCDQHPDLIGKEVLFTAGVFEYLGDYAAQVGDIRVFMFRDFYLF